jgi:hypothetical protein
VLALLGLEVTAGAQGSLSGSTEQELLSFLCSGVREQRVAGLGVPDPVGEEAQAAEGGEDHVLPFDESQGYKKYCPN